MSTPSFILAPRRLPSGPVPADGSDAREAARQSVRTAPAGDLPARPSTTAAAAPKPASAFLARTLRKT